MLMKLRTCAAMATALFFLTGCASTKLIGPDGKSLLNRNDLVTLTNLHPDVGNKNFLYSINYQRAGLIPVCTPVTLSDADDRSFKVSVRETGREYTFFQHKATPESLNYIANLYFGPSCDRATIDRLSAIDRKGIEQGEALPGMTRQGVIYAVGYPPSHRTPSMKSDRWVYWTSRFVTDVVQFENDRVVDGTR